MQDTTPHYHTLARMCVTYQVSIPRLSRIVDQLKLVPAMVLNETRYFDSAAVEAIHDELMKGETRIDKRRTSGEIRVMRH